MSRSLSLAARALVASSRAARALTAHAMTPRALATLSLVTAMGVLGVSSLAGAQPPGTAVAPARAAAPAAQVGAPAMDMMQFHVADPTMAFGPEVLALPAMLPGVPVTGAPYSAEAVTEMTQTLADGNRIVRTVTASVSRDSEGRTRRDQRLAALGPWMPDAQPRTVLIEDPVAHVSYMVDEEQKTAIKFPLMQDVKMDGGMGGSLSTVESDGVFETSTIEGVGGVTMAFRAKSAEHAEKREPAAGGEKGHAMGAAGMGVAGMGVAGMGVAGTRAFVAKGNGDLPPVENHDLGKQVIEGVEAVGTQSVTTIPAGAIGNEQPIRIVSEQWYAEALRTVVMSKRSDPRMGEVVYRLTNVDRSEPSPTLFQVPAEYTIKDMSVRERLARPKAEP